MPKLKVLERITWCWSAGGQLILLWGFLQERNQEIQNNIMCHPLKPQWVAMAEKVRQGLELDIC
uniref:Uncharacterized protein n=1 Tax=Arundo donax TaxID=35708 RepID=A0A0A9CRN2_ARUDO